MTAAPSTGPHPQAAPSTTPGTPCTIVGQAGQARVSQAEALRVLSRVHGMVANDALAALRFAAGTVCAPVARVVQQALADAERRFGLNGYALVLSGAEVSNGDVVTRVRRMAHGKAGWITTETTAVRIELSPIPLPAKE